MIKPTIQCKYSCKGCGLVKVIVTVEARREGEDVGAWLRRAVDTGIVRDHLRRSPLCMSRACDLMVPLGEEGSPIGAPVKPR